MTSQAFDGGEMIFHASATSAAETRYVPSVRDRADVLGAARVGRSPRFGDQSYFWTQDWQQAERLADFDYLVDMDYEPASLSDLLEWLGSDE